VAGLSREFLEQLAAVLAEPIAERVAELVLERTTAMDTPSPWLDADAAAKYLSMSRTAFYKLADLPRHRLSDNRYLWARRPRRTSVKNHPGIYYRESGNGKRRYEISFTDSLGKRRWKVVDGNLEAAEAAREELRGRIRKGERVVPTRLTLAELAAEWFAAQANLRPRTRERYELALRVHVLPRLGRARVSSITVDDVAWLIGEMQKAGLAGWTIRGHLTPLSRVMSYAMRKGMAGQPREAARQRASGHPSPTVASRCSNSRRSRA
jgi:hypothetical protein